MSAILTEYDAILRDVLLHPGEDCWRLIAADWLEDDGDPLRAEFIRVQVELADAPPVCPAWCPGPEDCRPAWLRRRERDLLAVLPVGRLGAPGLRDRASVLAERATVFGCCSRHADNRACCCLEEAAAAAYRRGFVAEATLTLDAFLTHAAALFSAHPVEVVRLSNRQPHTGRFHSDDGSGWEFQDRRFWLWDHQRPNSSACNHLPYDLYERLDRSVSPWHKQYLSEVDALAALSDACVAYGRHAAGLGVERG
jgi:uncharacterized protein (TIGR02996 family)